MGRLKNKVNKMEEQSNESIGSEKSESKNSIKKIEIKIRAKTKTHEISIETDSNLVDLPSDIDNIVNQLTKSKSFSEKNISSLTQQTLPEKPNSLGQTSSILENPIKLFATRLEVNPDDFEKLNLVAIKGDDTQILKTTKLGINENTLLLLALNEYVLNNPSISFEDWKAMFESSNIKTKTPHHKIINNCVTLKYIDKKKYAESRLIVLTAKGFEAVKKSIKKLLSS